MSAGGLAHRTREYIALQLPKQHGEGNCSQGSATWDGTWGKEEKGHYIILTTVQEQSLSLTGC